MVGVAVGDEAGVVPEGEEALCSRAAGHTEGSFLRRVIPAEDCVVTVCTTHSPLQSVAVRHHSEVERRLRAHLTNFLTPHRTSLPLVTHHQGQVRPRHVARLTLHRPPRHHVCVLRPSHHPHHLPRVLAPAGPPPGGSHRGLLVVKGLVQCPPSPVRRSEFLLTPQLVLDLHGGVVPGFETPPKVGHNNALETLPRGGVLRILVVDVHVPRPEVGPQQHPVPRIERVKFTLGGLGQTPLVKSLEQRVIELRARLDNQHTRLEVRAPPVVGRVPNGAHVRTVGQAGMAEQPVGRGQDQHIGIAEHYPLELGQSKQVDLVEGVLPVSFRHPFCHGLYLQDPPPRGPQPLLARSANYPIPRNKAHQSAPPLPHRRRLLQKATRHDYRAVHIHLHAYHVYKRVRGQLPRRRRGAPSPFVRLFGHVTALSLLLLLHYLL
eukprot:Hpha_TRINITY_DN4949_c0_g1::TRINITY_DN4949_c0_g1_i1::g.51267::m.51267